MYGFFCLFCLILSVDLCIYSSIFNVNIYDIYDIYETISNNNIQVSEKHFVQI